MYLKFNIETIWNGNTYKAGGVYYISNYQRFLDNGSAVEIADYDQYHEDNLKGRYIDVPNVNQEEC